MGYLPGRRRAEIQRDCFGKCGRQRIPYREVPSLIAALQAGGFQFVNLGGSEGTIYKFSGAGALQWASYFGGPAQEQITARRSLGRDLFILGSTLSSSGIATPGAFKTTLSNIATH